MEMFIHLSYLLYTVVGIERAQPTLYSRPFFPHQYLGRECGR